MHFICIIIIICMYIYIYVYTDGVYEYVSLHELGLRPSTPVLEVLELLRDINTAAHKPEIPWHVVHGSGVG